MNDQVKCGLEIALNEGVALGDALGTDKTWTWCIHWYQDDGENYCGDGELVACDKAGDLWKCDLSHCSRFGPGYGGVSKWMSLADFLASESVLDNPKYGIGEKIKELFGRKDAGQTETP